MMGCFLEALGSFLRVRIYLESFIRDKYDNHLMNRLILKCLGGLQFRIS